MRNVFFLMIAGLLAGCAGGSWSLGSLSNLSFSFDSPVGGKTFEPGATVMAQPPALREPGATVKAPPPDLGPRVVLQSAKRAE